MSGEISIYIVQYNLKKSLHIFYFFIVHNISTYFILLLSLYNSIVKETLLISVITYMSYLLFSVFTIPHRAIKIWIAEGVHHQRVKSTFCHFFSIRRTMHSIRIFTVKYDFLKRGHPQMMTSIFWDFWPFLRLHHPFY